jgi:LemA protein
MQSRKLRGYLIAGAVVLILLIWIVTTYNSLVNSQEKVKLQWNEVQNTYQRRLDLIPNLVNVVKGVSGFEQETLEKIANARASAMRAISTDSVTADNYNRQRQAQDTLAAAVNRLLIIAERYPVLKGTAAYAGLQTQLEGTERRIRVARNDFNASVATYNRKVRSFPSSLVAGMLGFHRKEGFTADVGTDKPVEINFKQ